MDNDEILDVLKQIRDQATQSNQKLESLDGRVEFLEKRVTRGFENLSEHLENRVQRIDALTRRQTYSELRLASEVLSLADVTREVRDLLSTKLDDHQLVMSHEERLGAIEDQIADRPPER